ncbi:MAG: DUF2764 family protein [Chlamydiota bacterium]
MTNYYFLATLIAPLSLDLDPEVHIAELKQLAALNLNHKDQRQMRLFLTWIDLNNLSALWSGHEINIPGNWTREELVDLQKFPLAAPSFLEAYLYKYTEDVERAAHFDQLLISYFSYAYEQATGFLKDYLQYEQVLRVAFAARRGTKLKRPFEEDLRLLDPIDPWQSQLHAVVEGGLDISGALENVQEALDLYDSNFQNPLDLFKQLLVVRFDKIEKLKAGYSPFSVDAIIAYAAELDIVSRWQTVAKAKNQTKVMTILKDIKA